MLRFIQNYRSCPKEYRKDYSKIILRGTVKALAIVVIEFLFIYMMIKLS